MKITIDHSLTPTESIKQHALELGFDVVKIGAGVDKTEELKVWLTKGYHGTMEWLERNPEVRGCPQNMWGDVKSVIVLGLNYGPEVDPRFLLEEKDKAYISIYARNKDYHDIIKKKLKRLGNFMAQAHGANLKVFVDTAPVMEKPLAQDAGIGWQGKHTCVVSREFGSWLFLGVIYTDLDLEKDKPAKDTCGKCSACQDACPTQAFVEPRVLDAKKCISYLTIEHNGEIPHELRPKMGNRIYGCDDCLGACPWNKFAKQANEIGFHHREELKAPNLRDLVQLDDTSFRELFTKSPIKRIKRDKFVRNVLIAIGNTHDSSYLDVVEPLLADPCDFVAEAATWAKEQIEKY